jgi:hypothetical protein
MSQMIRVNIYLTKSLEQHIELLSKRQRQPVAAVIRDLLSLGLHQKTKEQETAGSALLRLSQIGGTGPTDLATHHDDYLYGVPQ